MPGTKYFNNLIEKMQANPSKECPPGNDPNKIEQTYDGMILNLLQQVADQARKKVKESNATTDSEKEERATKEIHDGLAFHVAELGKEIARHEKELEEELKEQKKHITMDDIHEGFSTKVRVPSYSLFSSSRRCRSIPHTRIPNRLHPCP